MQSITHTGFDLFFANISNAKAKKLVQMLNLMNKTMNGKTLKFKINRKNSSPFHNNTTCITARYPAVDTDADKLTDLLAKNRQLMEVGINTLGWREVEYTGSEFYVEGSKDTLLAHMKTRLEETA